MFRPVPNSSHLTIAPPPADALLSPFHSPSATLACSPTQFNSTINSQKEQVSSPSAPLACSPTSNNSSANSPLGEQVKSEPWWISGGVEECIAKAEEIADAKFDAAAYAKRHASWMSTKIDCTVFLTYFIEGYPATVKEVRAADKSFWERFK